MVDAAWAASILVESHLKNELLDDLPADCKATSVEEALEIQIAILNHPDVQHVGWKVALTNKAGQINAGVTEPSYGPLFEQFIHQSGHAFANGAACLGGIECEFAVRLGKDLPASGAPYTMEQGADAIATMHPAIEITGMRFKTRPTLGRPGSTMDFSGNFACIFGEGRSDWHTFDLPNHGVKHIVDGTVVAKSTGAFVLGNPLNSICWLANKLATRGMSLKAGDWIITGAATGPIPVDPGAEVVADFGELGQVKSTMPQK
jgi:2-keto-4-pentenoate hydratase